MILSDALNFAITYARRSRQSDAKNSRVSSAGACLSAVCVLLAPDEV